MNTPMQLRHQAWRRMFLLRTCPPLGVLRRGGELSERHLASCAVCRENLQHASVHADIGDLLAKVPLPPRSQAPVSLGDIRRVRPGNAPEAWFDAEGRYHNPPLVLVLDTPDDMGFVRVAQVFGEQDLAEEGDILLLDDDALDALGRPLPDAQAMYAEAWNVYGLPVTGLAGKAFQRVAANHVTRVLEAAEQDFPALNPLSALYHFRCCELETGAFFSMALNAVALAEFETTEETRMAAPAQRLPFENPKIALHELRLPVWSMQGVEPMTETFYKMAAADGARLFEDKKNGITVRLYPRKIELHSRSPRTTVGVQFADSQGHVVLVHGVDLGRNARETGNQFEHEILVSRAPDDVASFVSLRPGNRVTVRPMGEHTPERVLLRVLTPTEV